MNSDIFQEIINKLGRGMIIDRINNTRVPDFISRSIYNVFGKDVSEGLMYTFQISNHKFYIIKIDDMGKDNLNPKYLNLLLNNNMYNHAIIVNTVVYDNNLLFYKTILDISANILRSFDIFKDYINIPLKIINFKKSIKEGNIEELYINLMIHIISLSVYLRHVDLTNDFIEYYLNILNKAYNMKWDEKFIRLVGYGQGVDDSDDLCLADYSILTAIRELYEGDSNE